MSKASKDRHCPAVNRVISSAECGSNRITNYPCPPECPFNPFGPANYAKLRELEDDVLRQASARVYRETPSSVRFASLLEKAIESRRYGDYEVVLQWHLYYQRDAAGLTAGERWERQGWIGLKNDGQVIARARLGTVMRALEIRRILNEEQLTAVDLLDDSRGEMLIQDRAIAASAARFQTILIWTYDLPHFTRTSGIGFSIPTVLDFEPLEAVMETVRHLGGPTEKPELQRWLSQNVVQVQSAMVASANARRRMSFKALDADFVTTRYELQAPLEECLGALDAIPEVQKEPVTRTQRRQGFFEARLWLEVNPAEQSAAAAYRIALGRILIGRVYLEIYAVGPARAAALRVRFESAMGNRVKFISERVEKTGEEISQLEPNEKMEQIVPSFIQRPVYPIMSPDRGAAALMQRKGARQDERVDDLLFLDERLPALDHHTPREAAKDSRLRPRLLLMMKQRVRTLDESNLIKGREYDMNWALEELGLREIILPPPPPRPQAKSAEGSKPAVEMDWDEMPDPQPLPDRPFTKEEMLQREKEIRRVFPNPRDAVEAVVNNGTELIETCVSLSEPALNETELHLLEFLAARIWLCFAPPGTFGPDLDLDRLAFDYRERLTALANAGKDRGALDQLLLPEPCQPVLAISALEELIAMAATPKRQVIQGKNILPMALLLFAVIKEIDRSMRGT